MFFQFLEHLRQKPVHVRNQYAFWFAALFVSVLGVLWLLALPQKFMGVQPTAETGTTPFAGLFGRLQPNTPELATSTSDAVEATSTPAVVTDAPAGTSTPTLPAIVLTEETLQAIASSARTATATSGTSTLPAGRPVLIATTSAEAAADTE